MVWHFMILPLSSFNTESINQIDTKIHSISSVKINSDINGSTINKNISTDLSKNKIDFNKKLSLTKSQIDNIWLLSQIDQTDIKSNNIINNQIVNLNTFWLELQLVPLSNLSNFVIYTTDAVKWLVVSMKVFKLWTNIDTVVNNGWNISINRTKSIWIYGQIWSQKWIYWDVSSTSNTLWSNFLDMKSLPIWSEYYYKDKGLTFDKKISIKPFYNLDENGNVLLQKDNPLFTPWYLYLIKIYFKLDKNKINNFKLYIPNGDYITLNNIEKISSIKKWKNFYINKVKIIKNWLINKIWYSTYWF